MTSTSVADSNRKQHRSKLHVETGIESLMEEVIEKMTDEEKQSMIEQMTTEMMDAAENMEFEKAAYLRDEIRRLQDALGKV